MEISRDNQSVNAPDEVLTGIHKAPAEDHVNEYRVHQVVASAMSLGERDAMGLLIKNHVRHLDGMFNGFFTEEE